MVTRPVFCPDYSKVGVKVLPSAAFKWNPGFSISQQQKNIGALHDAIIASGEASRPLEVSRKSMSQLGVKLSAFNLGVWSGGAYYTVESVYQASKMYVGGVGPFPDWYGKDPREVRQLMKALGSGRIVGYKVVDTVWELNPTRGFYDWLYCRALNKNSALAAQLHQYDCFTDIAFNPVRSLNCQAYAVALYLSLSAKGVLEEALASKEAFLKYHPNDVIDLQESNSAGVSVSQRSKRLLVTQLSLFS